MGSYLSGAGARAAEWAAVLQWVTREDSKSADRLQACLQTFARDRGSRLQCQNEDGQKGFLIERQLSVSLPISLCMRLEALEKWGLAGGGRGEAGCPLQRETGRWHCQLQKGCLLYISTQWKQRGDCTARAAWKHGWQPGMDSGTWRRGCQLSHSQCPGACASVSPFGGQRLLSPRSLAVSLKMRKWGAAVQSKQAPH